MDKPQIKAPGLKFRPRRDGWTAYWIPRDEAVKAGYPSGAVRLDKLLNDPQALTDRCETLQRQMQEWMDGIRRDSSSFNGTIRSALHLYETHPDSPYHKLKPGSRRPYDDYIRRLKPMIGDVNVLNVTGLDVKRWHATWTSNGKHIAAGHMAASVLKSALTFCVVAGHRQCRQLRDDIRELRLPKPKARQIVATAEQVAAARAAAHALGYPSAALCFALQFETALRLWDVLGQWYPMSTPFASAVVHKGEKWAGLEWRHIGPDLILRYQPSKTEHSSGAEVVVDLNLCPMVLEEFARISLANRSGPVILFERTGRPYSLNDQKRFWPMIRRKAELPADLWMRDLRASAITEARDSGGSLDDAAKLAGHSSPRITAAVYDRGRLEAHRRLAAARVATRTKKPD